MDQKWKANLFKTEHRTPGNRLRKVLFSINRTSHKLLASVVQTLDSAIHQTPVVRKLDSAIHRINRYPAVKYYDNQLRYPVDSAIHLSNNWGLINHYPADSVISFLNTYPLDSAIQRLNNQGLMHTSNKMPISYNDFLFVIEVLRNAIIIMSAYLEQFTKLGGEKS